MKKVKGIAAFAAAVMALNSATIVFAAKGPYDRSYQGTGSYEGSGIGDNVYSVELPAIPENTETYLNFIIDPEDLIALTNAEKYEGKYFKPLNKSFDGQTTIADEDLPAGFTTRKSKGFYFKNSGGFYDYTEKSDLITATNMGTDAIKISVAASLTECDDITLVDETEASFSWGNSAELSINLVEGDSDLLSSTTRGAISKDTDGNVVAATIDKNIDGITGTPTVNWNKTENKYEKTYTGVGESYSFYLQGAAGGNWSKVSDAAPKLDLTWIIKQDIGNADPGIDGGYNTTTKPLALSSTANTPLSLNLGAGDCEASGLTTLEFTQTAKPAFASVDLLAAANAGYVNIDVENSTLTFMKEFAADLKNAGITSGTVSLTFNNNKVVNNTTTPPSTSASTGSTATFTVTIN